MSVEASAVSEERHDAENITEGRPLQGNRKIRPAPKHPKERVTKFRCIACLQQTARHRSSGIADLGFPDCRLHRAHEFAHWSNMFGVTVLVLLSAALFRGAGQQYASITTTTMQNKSRFRAEGFAHQKK